MSEHISLHVSINDDAGDKITVSKKIRSGQKASFLRSIQYKVSHKTSHPDFDRYPSFCLFCFIRNKSLLVYENLNKFGLDLPLRLFSVYGHSSYCGEID